MFRKGLTLLLIFSLALNLAFVGVWGYHVFYVRPRLPGGRLWLAPPIQAGWPPPALGLRDEQRERMLAEQRRFRREMQVIQAEARRNSEELLDLVLAPQPDLEAIRARQREIEAKRSELQARVVKHLLSLKGTLTPEQQKRLIWMLRMRARGQSRGPFRRAFPRPSRRTEPIGRHTDSGQKERGPLKGT